MFGKNKKLSLEEAEWKRLEQETKREQKELSRKIKAVRKEKGKVKY